MKATNGLAGTANGMPHAGQGMSFSCLRWLLGKACQPPRSLLPAVVGHELVGVKVGKETMPNAMRTKFVQSLLRLEHATAAGNAKFTALRLRFVRTNVYWPAKFEAAVLPLLPGHLEARQLC